MICLLFMHFYGRDARAIYLREHRHVGAVRSRGVTQRDGETAQLRPSCHRQARLRVEQLLSRVHSVRSRPRQSLRDTGQQLRRGLELRKWYACGVRGRRTQRQVRSTGSITSAKSFGHVANEKMKMPDFQ